jgi:hypothetical protein
MLNFADYGQFSADLLEFRRLVVTVLPDIR